MRRTSESGGVQSSRLSKSPADAVAGSAEAQTPSLPAWPMQTPAIVGAGLSAASRQQQSVTPATADASPRSASAGAVQLVPCGVPNREGNPYGFPPQQRLRRGVCRVLALPLACSDHVAEKRVRGQRKRWHRCMRMVRNAGDRCASHRHVPADGSPPPKKLRIDGSESAPRWPGSASDVSAAPHGGEVRENGVHLCGYLGSRGTPCRLWVGPGRVCKFHAYAMARRTPRTPLPRPLSALLTLAHALWARLATLPPPPLPGLARTDGLSRLRITAPDKRPRHVGSAAASPHARGDAVRHGGNDRLDDGRDDNGGDDSGGGGDSGSDHDGHGPARGGSAAGSPTRASLCLATTRIGTACQRRR